MRRPAAAFLLFVASASAWAHARPAAAQPETAEALRIRAAELTYNLDREQAKTLLRRALELAPDDPATHRSLASVTWLQMLFQRGAVTVDHYLGSFSRTKVDLKDPPPDLDAEFRRHIEKAIALAEARVKARPDDPQAHYDLGAAVGLQASYIATVEGKLLAGFKAARRAYDAHEKVLELDPSRKDAGLIVGTYRYIVSTFSLPIRLMAYVAGFGGGRERGIAMIEEAAAYGENRADALFALILVYNRERQYDDALRALEELRRLYPRNRLVVLEAGATALRADRPERAEALLTEGLAMLASDRRPRIPGEEALWKLKRGTARAEMKKIEAARADLEAATSPDAQAWVQGRARVELAELALARGDRRTAAGEARQARTLCERGNDPVCVNAARSLLRKSDGD